MNRWWGKIIFFALMLVGTKIFSASLKNSVSVIFDKEIKEKGIKVWIGPKSGGESIKEYSGKTGLQTNLNFGSTVIYCDVKDEFIYGGRNKVFITIEYWDGEVEGEKGIEITYDSTGNERTKLPKIYLEGSKKWKTISYFVDNAQFTNRQKGADIRVYSVETDICIGSITIEKVPDYVPLEKIEILPDKVEIFEEETKYLTCIFTPYYSTEKFVTWSSSNPKIVEIKSLGHICWIKGISEGNATITAKSIDGKISAYCKVKVIPVPGKGVVPKRVSEFLDSIGVNSSINTRGEILEKTIDAIKYTGIRWIRCGIGLKWEDYYTLYKETGVKFSLGLTPDFNKLIKIARKMDENGMLLAFEGPNEPNNWAVTYQGEVGGGRQQNSWIPIAKFQRDGYNFIKSDPILKRYPVWQLSETGAEVDNVGVQFLSIPKGAGTVMPAGTIYADYANCHNYACHPTLPPLIDNQAWYAADPVMDKVPGYNGLFDGLYGSCGRTWLKKYPGYSAEELIILPRVTTETGITLNPEKGITEEVQSLLYLHIYLSQFKRGWSYTSIYILRDRTDETGNQTFGFFRPDYSPRKAAIYLHNLTSILSDKGQVKRLRRLDYKILTDSEAVHDLLLQRSDGRFYLIVWNERLGSKRVDEVVIDLGKKYPELKIYDVTIRTEPVKILKNTDTITLKLNSNVVIIEI